MDTMCNKCEGRGQVYVGDTGNCGSPWEECSACKGSGSTIVVDPKRTGVKATYIYGFVFHAALGACMWHAEDNRLSFVCPGCGKWGSVRCEHPKPKESPSWDITGGSIDDVTTLTLSPSINCVGCCGWHGYLRNGVFESC